MVSLYIINKIYSNLLYFFLRKKPGYIIIGKAPKNNEFLFDFSDKNNMHLGDSLFFIPLIKLFIKNNYRFKIIAYNNIKELYHCYGIPSDYFDIPHLFKPNILVSNWGSRKPSKNKYSLEIYINATDSKISLNIGSFIVGIFADIFQDPSLFLPVNYIIKPNKSNLSSDIMYNYVIVSDEVSSGKFRVTNSMKFKLYNYADKLRANSGARLVHTGLKVADFSFNKFIDFELGSNLSVIDLVNLINSDRCIGVISFDTLTAHVACLASVPSYILLKKRVFRHNSEFIKKFLFPIIPHANLKLINFI